jgi:uncharacterized protein DUF3606
MRVDVMRHGLSQTMFDDKSKSVGERKRINVHDDYELRFWSKKFGVSPNELRCAEPASLPMMLLASSAFLKCEMRR